MTSIYLGSTYYYRGEKYWQQYQGIPLKVREYRLGSGWTLEKPDGYRTTGISAIDLSPLPVSKPVVRLANKLPKAKWLVEWEHEQSYVKERL